MLKDNEWALLQELIDVFKPFDELTTYLSGIKYSTLSAVNPIIESLKLKFADYSVSTSNELEINEESVPNIE
ncbi:14326_t:CDS:1, partial [Gigaspora margarita]